MAVLCCTLATGPAAAQSGGAAAQAWKPSKSTEFIVPSGAGAALDQAARKLTELLARDGHAPQFVVSNKSGAHAIAALESLHRHPGDAHTLMTLSTSYGNSLAQNALPAHLQKGTPLVTLLREFTTVVVRADLAAAQCPGPDRPAAPGPREILHRHRHHAGQSHPSGRGPALAAGRREYPEAAHRPLQILRRIHGGAGRRPSRCGFGHHAEPAALSAVGRVRVLAIAADKRLEGVFAQSPTWKEQGIDYVSDSFQGVMTAPGASTAQQAWVNALRKVSETREWKEFVALNQWEPIFLGPQDTARALHAQVERSHALLTELGLLPPSASRIAQAR
jgi:putative tricarboxylic transport membrane protein